MITFLKDDFHSYIIANTTEKWPQTSDQASLTTLFSVSKICISSYLM